MGSVKEEFKKIIESLPDDATWEDLMNRVYVRAKQEDSQKAADAGSVVSGKEMEREIPTE
jgi:hypothetical protein